MTEPEREWIYAVDGKRRGPASAAEIATLISGDRLPSGTLVWKQGMAEWAAARDVPAIARLCAPPVPTGAQTPVFVPHDHPASGSRPVEQNSRGVAVEVGAHSPMNSQVEAAEDGDWQGVAEALAQQAPSVHPSIESLSASSLLARQGDPAAPGQTQRPARDGMAGPTPQPAGPNNPTGTLVWKSGIGAWVRPNDESGALNHSPRRLEPEKSPIGPGQTTPSRPQGDHGPGPSGAEGLAAIRKSDRWALSAWAYGVLPLLSLTILAFMREGKGFFLGFLLLTIFGLHKRHLWAWYMSFLPFFLLAGLASVLWRQVLIPELTNVLGGIWLGGLAGGLAGLALWWSWSTWIRLKPLFSSPSTAASGPLQVRIHGQDPSPSNSRAQVRRAAAATTAREQVPHIEEVDHSHRQGVGGGLTDVAAPVDRAANVGTLPKAGSPIISASDPPVIPLAHPGVLPRRQGGRWTGLIYLVLAFSVAGFFFRTEIAGALFPRAAVGSAERPAPVAALALAGDKSFRRVQLAYGISIDVPSHWTVLSQDERRNLGAAGQAMADNAGIEASNHGKETLLAVNAVPSPTGAMIRVSVTSSMDYTQTDLAGASPGDLEAINAEWLSILKKIEASGSLKVVEVQPVRIEEFNKYRALVMPYVRASSYGPSPWQVTQYKIPVHDRLIEITLSHRQSDAMIWRPILEKVKRSVLF